MFGVVAGAGGACYGPWLFQQRAAAHPPIHSQHPITPFDHHTTPTLPSSSPPTPHQRCIMHH